MNKYIVIVGIILIASLFLMGCTDSTPRKTCTTSADCKDWQFCDTERSVCAPKPGFCEKASDCGDVNKYNCNTKTNRCEFKAGYCEFDADCGYWQVCDTTLGECRLRAGFCDSNEFCL